jgi:Tfp pilus assembly protein FimT
VVQNLAREQTEEPTNKIIALMQTAQSENVQLSAAREVLDRGWGKPAQTIKDNVNDKRRATDWSRDELVAFLNDDWERRGEAPKGDDSG